MGRRAISINIPLVLELYNKGISISKIAQVGGISDVTVYNYVKKHKNDQFIDEENLSKEQINKIIDMKLNGLETKEIEKILGLSSRIVNEKLNIILEKTSEPVKMDKIEEVSTEIQEVVTTPKDEITALKEEVVRLNKLLQTELEEKQSLIDYAAYLEEHVENLEYQLGEKVKERSVPGYIYNK